MKVPGKKPAQQQVPPQPTGQKPALVIIPGKKPAPKQGQPQPPPQATGQKPAFMPKAQTVEKQPAAVKKPAVILIPKKKQP